MPVITEIYVRENNGGEMLPVDSYDNKTISEIVVDGKSYHFALDASAYGERYLVCEDAVDEPLLSFNIEGNSIQDGTPTPDAPVEIESVGELVTDTTDANYGKYKIPIVCRGKNLFNPHIDDKLTAWYRIGFEKTFNDDNSFNLSTTSLRMNYCYLGGTASYAANQECFIPQGETVTTFGTWDCVDDAVCIGVCFYGADKVLVRQFNSSQNGTIGKWKVTKDVYYISYVIRLPNHVAGDAIDINNINIQVELGNTATPFEPYVEPVLTNVYLKEPLRKIGYCFDTLDLKNKKAFHYIGDYRIDENTNWINVTLQNNGVYIYAYSTILDEIATNETQAQYCLSNKLAPNEPITVTTKHDTEVIAVSYQTYAKLRIAIDKNRLNSVSAAALSEWLANNPIDVIYILNEPIEESFECDIPITVEAETSIVEIDTTIAPSAAFLDYWKQVKPNV